MIVRLELMRFMKEKGKASSREIKAHLKTKGRTFETDSTRNNRTFQRALRTMLHIGYITRSGAKNRFIYSATQKLLDKKL